MKEHASIPCPGYGTGTTKITDSISSFHILIPIPCISLFTSWSSSLDAINIWSAYLFDGDTALFHDTLVCIVPSFGIQQIHISCSESPPEEHSIGVPILLISYVKIILHNLRIDLQFR